MLQPITEIADRAGLPRDLLEPFGDAKAKIKLDAVERLKDRPLGKYVVTTAITPTPLGEGKTLTTIGLSLGLSRIGRRAICTLRQPSLGPVFGLKGGATGGGRSQVLPAEDINLHLTGDAHAVTAAHNLLAAFLDNHLHHGSKPAIDAGSITYRRCMDMNDRALRRIVAAGRETGFDLTAASEVMAILALATSYRDLKERLGRIIVGATTKGAPFTAKGLSAAGAMALLLRDALKPNLLQTSEGTPAIIHAGPFANIAHGNSSIVADLVALRLADFVCTESGFAADLGFEKFVDLKCRASGLRPDAAVIVCTVRALKVHSGKFAVVAGKPLPKTLGEEDVGAVVAGLDNLRAMLEIVGKTGTPAVVAINRFEGDTDREIDAIRAAVPGAEVVEAHGRGGAGAEALARAVVRAAETPHEFRFLQDAAAPVKTKIESLAKNVYGADGVAFAPEAEERIALYTRWGLDRLPVCVAKTQLSLSDDPARKGRPRGWTLKISDVRVSAGAGFLYALAGSVMTMPGLGSTPGGARMGLTDAGEITGLL